VLVRFAYLAVTHAFAALRILPMTDREKDVEILALRHQLTVLQRQLGDQRPQLRPEDRAPRADPSRSSASDRASAEARLVGITSRVRSDLSRLTTRGATTRSVSDAEAADED
jgi:hypothetical protein